MIKKIFCIGFQKTGTKSMRQALEVLGYACCGPKPNLLKQIKDKKWVKITREIEKYDAFEDNPWPLIYKELDKKFPGSKFILTTRKPENWIKSTSDYFGKKETEMRKWIYGKGSPIGNKIKYINKYKDHNKKVLDYFRSRPDDLLIIDLEKGNGWKELCKFLNKPTQKKPFPHINKGKKTSSQLSPITRTIKCFKEHGFTYTYEKTKSEIKKKYYKDILKSNVKFPEKVCILGSGPKGKKFYDKIPKDYTVVAVNRAVLIPSIKPDIWIMNNLNSSNMAWFLKANKNFKGLKIFRKDTSLNYGNAKYYFDALSSSEDQLSEKDFRPIDGKVRSKGTVAGCAIQIAYNLGAKEILLCGIDMSGDKYWDGTANQAKHSSTWPTTKKLSFLINELNRRKNIKISTLSPTKLKIPTYLGDK